MQIDAVLSPAEIDLLGARDLGNTVCVVFDVLRATSSLLTALANGVDMAYPVTTIEEALALKEQMPEALLAGERHGERIDGFDLGNSPLEYLGLGRRKVISTTTNGTVALRACQHAKETVAGAILNAASIVEYLQGAAEVLLVCAGTFREPALEDMLGAGLVASAFPKAGLSDAARACKSVFQEHQSDLYAGLAASRNAQVLLGKGREEEVRWCARDSHLDVVGVLRGPALVRVI